MMVKLSWLWERGRGVARRGRRVVRRGRRVVAAAFLAVVVVVTGAVPAWATDPPAFTIPTIDGLDLNAMATAAINTIGGVVATAVGAAVLFMAVRAALKWLRRST